MIRPTTIIMTALLIFIGCNKSLDGQNTSDPANWKDKPGDVEYASIYDQLGDGSQFQYPETKVIPKKLWTVTGSWNNDPSLNGTAQGLQYHLLSQSLAGIVNRAVEQGRSQVGMWIDRSGDSYDKCLDRLSGMGVGMIGKQTALELLSKDYGEVDGIKVTIRDLVDGYVLTDVKGNPESAIVASTAAHVFNSIIVDIRDEQYFKDLGFCKTYDARSKTTANAWDEFGDKCSKEALVVMPVQTAEIREFAISHNLFTINLNKIYGTSSRGQNSALLKTVLASLNSGAMVLGWEQGVGEDVFVTQVSRYGHQMIPCDWSYNHSLLSLAYRSERKQALAPVFNPRDIQYWDNRPCVSFMLSDGDNVQWMMNDFSSFLTNPAGPAVAMTYQMAAGTLPMMAPSQMGNLFGKIPQGCSVIEGLGGGYYYVDDYGEQNGRLAALRLRAAQLGKTMREHRVKVVAVMAHNVLSAKALQGYQEIALANGQLEGIVAVQYSPYAGGFGEVLWVTNGEGVEIPVVTVRYSLWNFGSRNNEREGSPAYIASKLNEGKFDFSLVCVHAWSKFSDHGKSPNLTIENQGGNLNGASAAKLCVQSLENNSFNIVTVNELVWRLRMAHNPEQTEKILSELR